MYPPRAPGLWPGLVSVPSLPRPPAVKARPSQRPPPPRFLTLQSALCLLHAASLVSEPPPRGHVGLALHLLCVDTGPEMLPAVWGAVAQPSPVPGPSRGPHRHRPACRGLRGMGRAWVPFSLWHKSPWGPRRRLGSRV